MFTVYVLTNPAGRLYVGQTRDLTRRLVEHRGGLAGWTTRRGPWKLVLHETFATRGQAMQRERVLKSGRGRRWLREELRDTTSLPGAE